MENKALTGQKGEQTAMNHLVVKGYRILHQNWRSGQKEVDIIALAKDVLVFVEVKTRSSTHILEPARAVTRSKQKLIISAAQAYVSRFNENREVRFDIITVVNSKDGDTIEHIEDAYRSYAR